VRSLSEDTIVALATGAGAAGLAVVRLSGPAALAIAARLFQGADLQASETHRAHHGWIVDEDGERIDEAVALVLRAPHGYTGEDTVELSCHGGTQVVDEVVAAALAAGARVAEPGEFTRRAFLNGKLDLCQAEAVADLIAAHGRAARRAALAQLRGRLSDRLAGVRSVLLDLLADVEASVDFVEEGLEFFDRERARTQIADVSGRVEALLATAGDGVLLRSGVRVSLSGSPNVGKSSLFNRMLEEERSIVTEHPGTTRDVVRETVRIGDLAIVLEDTAGVRAETGDPVEQLGIERSRRSRAEADVVLVVVDASRPLDAEEEAALAGVDPQSALVVVNKIDLLQSGNGAARLGGPARPTGGALLESLARGSAEPASSTAAHHHEPATKGPVRPNPAHRTNVSSAHPGVATPARLAPGLGCVAVSARTGEGLDTLREALSSLARLRQLAEPGEEQVAIGQRHREALLRARTTLLELDSDVRTDEPPEILALSLRTAVAALDEISGQQVTEEILDRIFARFCIGK
jgi:tRNA modification GTPase